MKFTRRIVAGGAAAFELGVISFPAIVSPPFFFSFFFLVTTTFYLSVSLFPLSF
jgi:hypothetical protein